MTSNNNSLQLLRRAEGMKILFYYSTLYFVSLSVWIIVAEPVTYHPLPKSLLRRTTPITTYMSSAQTLSYNTDHTIMDCGVEIILTTLLLNWVYSNTMKSSFSLFAVYVCTNIIYTYSSIKTLHAIHQSIFDGISVSISFAFYVKEVG